MNKQEVIEKLHSEAVNHYSETSGWFKEIKLDIVTDIVNQIYEPRKAILNEEEAEWLERLKKCSGHSKICDTLYYVARAGFGFGFSFRSEDEEIELDTLKLTLNEFKNLKERLVKALIYGYEVKKEKLYTVELPNPNKPDTPEHFVLRKNGEDKVDIAFYYVDWWRDYKCTWLTEAEIKKDYAWAWQFAEEVENDNTKI